MILDLGLPGKNGFSVLLTVRQRDPDLPVIILTARDSVEDTVAGLDSGADDYMPKPFKFQEASDGRQHQGEPCPYDEDHAHVPTIQNPPANPPKVCTQQTATLPMKFGGRTRQNQPWGTPPWERVWPVGRTAAERTFTSIKDPNRFGLKAKGRIRVRGITGITFILALVAVARNLHLAETWRQEDKGDHTAEPDPQPIPRPNAQAATIDEHIAAATDSDPPEVAHAI